MSFTVNGRPASVRADHPHLLSALREELDDREAIELCMLVGHYDMLATVLGTLRVQTDVPRARG